jgi:hypothetical protein
MNSTSGTIAASGFRYSHLLTTNTGRLQPSRQHEPDEGKPCARRVLRRQLVSACPA